MKKTNGIFRTADGVNHLLTFALVCSLFLSSGICNGMIDVLNKHFQNSLGISKTQSAAVQAAWYAAYFLMAFPSGWVARASLAYPYLFVVGLVAVLVAVFYKAPLPDLQAEEEGKADGAGKRGERPLFKEWHFLLAIVSQFLYVAGQTGIFSFFINYVRDERYMPTLPTWLADLLPEATKYLQGGVWHITEYGAGLMLSLAFVLFTIGRFSGSAILRFCRPHLTLGVYASINMGLMLLVILRLGWFSVAALMASFFFMSIMYPTHFALGIRGLGERTKFASSCMVTAIIGGAVMPMFMGWLADKYSMGIGFVMPLVCFGFIAAYGFGWRRLFSRDMEPDEKAAAPMPIH